VIKWEKLVVWKFDPRLKAAVRAKLKRGGVKGRSVSKLVRTLLKAWVEGRLYVETKRDRPNLRVEKP
jgi:hypothetical protein